MIQGDAGTDILTGGAGSDVFLLAVGGYNTDTILDFEVSEDIIAIHGWRNGPQSIIDDADQLGHTT